MDFSVILKGVKNLNNYISLTQDLESKYSDTKIEFNLATLQSLKNIRSMEIEYFNKCDGTGAALIIMDRIMQVPPSISWSLLGTEVVYLIQYWLDAVRKHIINHHRQWWSFLKHLLDFTKALIEKNSCFNNLLLEHMTDGLLDLATRGKLDINQRHEILRTLNLYCLKCSKKLRYAYRNQFEHYFVRLATIMANCGHVPTQYAIMETLLRWLVLRREQSARREAAHKWLPTHLYQHGIIQLFVEREWHNFEQDARDFLNAHNENGDLITSVLCKKLSVGDVVLVSGSERRQAWLDMNLATRCVTVLLVPAILHPLGISTISCETLSIDGDMARCVKLYREQSEVTISIVSDEPPSSLPSLNRAIGDPVHMRAVISSRSHMHVVDNALRAIFDDKYDVLLDFDNIPVSPGPSADDLVAASDREGFAQLPKIRRSRHIGQVVKSCRPSWLGSPSSVSTSSLAQLHDKLDAIPRIPFDKEPVAVCESPELSEVAELPEGISSNSINTAKHCDVLTRRFHINRQSQSDTEIARRKKQYVNCSDSDDKRSDVTQNFFKCKKSSEFEAPKNKNVEAIIDEDSTSCLLVTTIGSADQSVINDTLERLGKDNVCRPDNIVDLLVKEALQFKPDDKIFDSGINTGEGKKAEDYDSEVIENTYEFTQQAVSVSNKKTEMEKSNKYTVVSKSTSDESNTEVVNETPHSYVTVRRNKFSKRNVSRRQSEKLTDDIIENEIIDAPCISPKSVEDFFSQHCTEQKVEGIISPTLARKLNATSSESSEEFGQCLMDNADYITNVPHEFPDVEVVECLNDVVDKVCSAFDKYCEYFARNEGQDKTDTSKVSVTHVEQMKTTAVSPKIASAEQAKEPETITKGRPKRTTSIKLKYKTPKTRATRQKKVVDKLTSEKPHMSPIIEAHNEISDKSHNITTENLQKNSHKPANDSTTNEKNSELETPLARRRRKLFSPKIDPLVLSGKNCSEENKKSDSSDEDVALVNLKKPESLKGKSKTPTLPESKTPALPESSKKKFKAYDYSDIEKDRENYRILRSKKAASKPKSSSPRTKKRNDLFDKVKETIENNEDITVVDPKSVKEDNGEYNFTSDSDEEDFKQKKELQKRVSSTTLESGTTALSTRRRSRSKLSAKSTEKEVSSDDNTKKKPHRKNPVKNTNSKTKLRKTVNRNLEDERMRKNDNPETFNMSLVVEKGPELEVNVQNPQIISPGVEITTDNEQIKEQKKEVARNKSKDTRKDSNIEANKTHEEDRTISPLPGLVIEKENPSRKADDMDDSISTNLEQKLKKAFEEGTEALLLNNDTNTTHNLLSDLEKTNIIIPANEDFDLDEAIRNVDKSPFKKVSQKSAGDKNVKLAENVPDDNLETIPEGPTDNGADNSIDQIDEENEGDISVDNRSTTSSKQRKRRSLQLKTRRYPTKITDRNSQNTDLKTQITKNVTDIVYAKSPKGTRSRGRDFIKLNINKVSEISKLNKKSKSTQKSGIKAHTESEIFEISDVTEAKTEKSIATIGITARGALECESNEESKNLDESITPRELADMDDDIKDYYIKLRAQIRQLESSEGASTSKEPNKAQRIWENKIDSSPVVSVSRMPTEEVMNWLSGDKQKKQKTNIIDDDIARYLPSRRNSSSSATSVSSKPAKSEKSLAVSLCRLSPIEMEKYISPKDDTNKHSPLRFTSRTKTSTPEKRIKHKTIISPVKLFEELPRFRLSKINDEFPTLASRTSDTSRSVVKSPNMSVSKRYFLRSTLASGSSYVISPSRKVSRKSSTPQKRRSPSTVVASVEVKRRKISVTLDHDRRQAFDKEISGETRQNTPSVRERISEQPRKIAATTDSLTRDALQLINERLDTTLAEIHQNTTENLISLFINVQKQLSEMQEERLKAREHILENIADLQTRLAQIEADVTKYNERSHEREIEFANWFKNCAAGFLRTDCKRKRTMVSLLREDIENMFDYGDHSCK